MNDAPKLLLINPAERTSKALPYPSSDFLFPSLGLAVIARLTPEPWQVTLIDEQIEELPDIATLDCDLVGITAFTQQARRAYEIAAEFRARGVKVVLGGIHPSATPYFAGAWFLALFFLATGCDNGVDVESRPIRGRTSVSEKDAPRSGVNTFKPHELSPHAPLAKSLLDAALQAIDGLYKFQRLVQGYKIERF